MPKAIVIDDSRAMRMLLARTLAQSGFDVVQAAGGQEGLDALGREHGVELVLVDWNMPLMSGLEFIVEARKRSEFAGVKMIMVTTETEIEQMARALEAGADEYIMKPFTADAITDKLRLLQVLK